MSFRNVTRKIFFTFGQSWVSYFTILSLTVPSQATVTMFIIQKCAIIFIFLAFWLELWIFNLTVQENRYAYIKLFHKSNWTLQIRLGPIIDIIVFSSYFLKIFVTILIINSYYSIFRILFWKGNACKAAVATYAKHFSIWRGREVITG